MKTTLRHAASYLSSLSLLFFLPVFAYAQVYEPTPSPALACLTLTSGATNAIEYPEEALKRKDGGTIVVNLEFNGPESAPDVDIVDGRSAHNELVLAVKKHVKRFRIPCMKQGDQPVRFRQEYIFLPHDARKIVDATPVDLAVEEKKKLLQCITHLKPGSKPHYPIGALRREAQGNFLVSLKFENPTGAPDVKWLAAANDIHLKESIAYFVEGLRMPCFSGAPLETTFLYKFSIDDGSRVFLKDSDLVSFLRSARDMYKPVQFDFDTMNCPFDLRVNYRRPYAPSHIGELENSNIARKPFLEWLSTVTLDLKEDDNNRVLGSIFTLHVPCGSLKL